MKNLFVVAGSAAVVTLVACQSPAPESTSSTRTPPVSASMPTSFDYPASPTVAQVDHYHGTDVADPFRWLEEDSPQSKQWINAQREFTEQYLLQMPTRELYKDRLTTLWNYERFSTPAEAGGRYFYTHNNGLQNQSVLYVQEKAGAQARVLLDPNTLSADGTVALSGTEISKNGRYLAYGVSKSGSDWQTWAVRDVRSGQDLNDNIEWVKFSSAAWTPDEKGFYYARYDAPKSGEELSGQNYFQKLYFHKIGTPQSADILIYHRPDQKEWGFGATVTDDGQWLVIPSWQGTDTRNRVFYKALTGKDRTVKPLIENLEAEYDFIGNDGPVFYFKTDLQAERGRIVAIDVRKSADSRLKEVVPQTDNTLRFAMIAGNRLVLSYLKDAVSHVEIRNMKGALEHTLALQPGTAGGFKGKRESNELFYSLTSYVQPTTIYRFDLASKKASVYREPKVDFDASQFVSEQVFYTSKDGTRVPMTLNYKKGLQKTGKNPTILYGYGGFNIALTPAFNAANIAWLERGGIYAVANLRGGGEYGETWHKAGTKAQKQNVFDDFIAAAEWLAKEQYTSARHLGIHGGSNGGLLVGAAMTQRPELFGAAVPAVGVLDMLRFQKFTIGWAWTSDYGSADNAEDFPYLYAYSPLHNLKDGEKYPATMIMTADHDDRVVPYHSFKFAARLQQANASSEPMLIRIESKAGHGAGKPISKLIEDKADFFAFLEHHLN